MMMIVMVIALPSCGDDDEPENAPTANVDDERIFGTWEGDFMDETFVLTFTKDGKFIESVDGDTATFEYSLKDGKLTITPDDSALNDIMGYDIRVSFSGSNSMTIKCNLWDMTLKKK